MGRNHHQVELELPLWKAPDVIIPTIRVPQPDGSILIRAGKPIISEEMIGTAEAAGLLGMSRRWVETECSEGRFATAHKPGTLPKSRWKVARSEVLARKQTPSE